MLDRVSPWCNLHDWWGVRNQAIKPRFSLTPSLCVLVSCGPTFVMPFWWFRAGIHLWCPFNGIPVIRSESDHGLLRVQLMYIVVAFYSYYCYCHYLMLNAQSTMQVILRGTQWQKCQKQFVPRIPPKTTTTTNKQTNEQTNDCICIVVSTSQDLLRTNKTNKSLTHQQCLTKQKHLQNWSTAD